MKASEFHMAMWLKGRIEEEGFTIVDATSKHYVSDVITVRHKVHKNVVQVFSDVDKAHYWVMGFVRGSHYAKV